MCNNILSAPQQIYWINKKEIEFTLITYITNGTGLLSVYH